MCVATARTGALRTSSRPGIYLPLLQQARVKSNFVFLLGSKEKFSGKLPFYVPFGDGGIVDVCH
jgi:hypothetical protein